MSLVQEYKNILNTLYGMELPRLKDEGLRTQLSNIWFQLSDDEQDQVQAYSKHLRK